MAYNSNTLQQQIQDLGRQYQQLINQQNVPFQQTQIPQMQMPTPPVQIPIVQSRQVQYVEGMAGARLYQDGLPSNSSEIIMDKDGDIFYMVSKDANGTPSKRIPHGHFIIDEDEEEEPAFLTRKDFDEFKEEIRQLFASSSQQKPSVQLPAAATTQKITPKKD